MDQTTPNRPLPNRILRAMWPQSAQIEAGVTNWPKVRAIAALMTGAAIGGAAGFAAYGLPFVFTAAFYTGVPLLGVAAAAKTVEWLLPADSGARASMRRIGAKFAKLGGACTFFPVLAAGAVTMAATHFALIAAGAPFSIFGMEKRQQRHEQRQKYKAAATAALAAQLPRVRQSFTRISGDFRAVALRVYRGEASPEAQAAVARTALPRP